MRYIGNKTRMLDNIEKFITAEGIKGETFCDIFAGTSSVGDHFKNKYKIIANDFLYSSSAIAKGKLYNCREPKFEKFIKEKGTNPFEYLNEIEYQYNEQYFITKNYSPMGDRQFFTQDNAIKIDGMRIEIENLYKDKLLNENEYFYLMGSLIESVMGVSNTTGTYEAFLKKWDNRAFKKIEIKPLEINDIKEKELQNEVYNENANKLIRKIAGDILYIDPPYTITEYSAAYHVLETLAKYDYPVISGKTGRRSVNDKKSLYSKKSTALGAFEDLIRQANFKDIIISYSNQSLIPLKELKEMLSKYAIDKKVNIKKYAYREYKNLNASQKGDTLYEVLIHIKKDLNIMKSPLNYSGSKNDIVSQIIKYLPMNVSTFVDAMGGAFNVGANIIATNTVVYNEYNPFVYEIIKYILSENKNNLIKDVEGIIKKFKLQKGNKEAYLNFREYYNNNQTPLNLLVLQMFCFQNQLRFNSEWKFNTPIGNCSYNKTIKERIKTFIPKTKNIKLTNLDYKDIDLEKFDKDTLFYFDPPYFITNATYNDGKRGFKGWDADEETKLLEFLVNLDKKGYKFMLSNVLEHKGKENKILKECIKEHDFNCIDLKHALRKEVLIVNYEV